MQLKMKQRPNTDQTRRVCVLFSIFTVSSSLFSSPVSKEYMGVKCKVRNRCRGKSIHTQTLLFQQQDTHRVNTRRSLEAKTRNEDRRKKRRDVLRMTQGLGSRRVSTRGLTKNESRQTELSLFSPSLLQIKTAGLFKFPSFQPSFQICLQHKGKTHTLT